MALILVDRPVGSVGDWYLLSLFQTADEESIPDASDGFTLVATGGGFGHWAYLFAWQSDGSELSGDYPFDVALDGVGGYYTTALYILSGADTLTAAVNELTGDVATFPTFDIDAATTTVDESLLLIGYSSKYHYLAPPTLLSGTVDTLEQSFESDRCLIWSLEQVAAGVAGPWQVDRSDEYVDATQTPDPGVLGWTVIAAPVALDPAPTIFLQQVSASNAVDVPMQPEPYVLTGPNGEGPVTIGGETQEEQDALIAAQLAEWAAMVVVDPLTSAYAANVAWLAAPSAYNTQTEALTAQMQLVINELDLEP